MGGVSDSTHLEGLALDLAWPAKLDQELFYKLACQQVGAGGLGRYPWGIHVDVRDSNPPRRWKRE
jgi:uncharacterized protein YcbK (DUF882 family)